MSDVKEAIAQQEAAERSAPPSYYAIPEKMQADLESRFTYHSPKGDQPTRYESLRCTAKALALEIVTRTPPSREQSLALTHLEEAIFYANAAIARHE